MRSQHTMSITFQVQEREDGKYLHALASVKLGELVSVEFVQTTVEMLQKEFVKRIADETTDDILKAMDMEVIVKALTIKVAEAVALKMQAIPSPTPDRRLEQIRQQQEEYYKQVMAKFGRSTGGY